MRTDVFIAVFTIAEIALRNTLATDFHHHRRIKMKEISESEIIEPEMIAGDPSARAQSKNDILDEAIEAINQEPFDMSSTDFPYKREHQEEGLNIAIKAIEALKTEPDPICKICEKEDATTNGFCTDCAREHYSDGKK